MEDAIVSMRADNSAIIPTRAAVGTNDGVLVALQFQTSEVFNPGQCGNIDTKNSHFITAGDRRWKLTVDCVSQTQ